MTAEHSMNIGLVGAGRMGTPIIGHLVKNGFSVQVHDVDTGKRSTVEEYGATFVPGRNDLARTCGVILICVGYEDELREMLAGTDGMLGALARGTVTAVLSTVSPDIMAELSGAAVKYGVDVIDAPVCRGSWAADAGELLTLIGGTEHAAARFSDVARAYSSDVVRVGDVGAGQVAKAVNNLILWACLVADHEGLALGHRYGLDVDVLRGALQISSASNNALDNWGQQTMAWAEDDMKIVSEMAAAKQTGLPQAALNREICRVLKPRRYDLNRYGAPPTCSKASSTAASPPRPA